jgi:hypothetical protein
MTTSVATHLPVESELRPRSVVAGTRWCRMTAIVSNRHPKVSPPQGGFT